jgi:ABC-type glycerol-3-phosphate transport system permease component
VRTGPAEELTAGRARPGRRAFPFHPGRVLRQAFLLVSAAVVVYPIYFMVTTAFKSREDYLNSPLGFPWPLEWGNFSAATQGGSFGRWFLNSTVLALGSTALVTLIAALGAFALARMRFRGRSVLATMSTALMIVPPVVMIVPLFILFTNLSLTGTYPGVILIYAGLTLPFSAYMLTTFFRAVPRELFEAAALDGASHLRILWRVVLPLSAPALVTLVVVNTLWVWNDLLIALVFLPSDELKTLMVGVTVFRSRFNLDVPITMAGLLLAALPMLLVYLFGQRFFIRGLTAGAVKG